MSARSLMIFAAGKGTRMGALTHGMPKPMVEVGGRPLIDHALALARDAAYETVVANVHYKPNALISLLKAQGVAIADERPKLLETGGGLKAALPLLGNGPVATLNADAIWSGPNALVELKKQWSENHRALLALVPKDRAHGHTRDGDFSMSPEGELTRGGPLVYTGAQILDPSQLDRIQDEVFSLNRYWNLLAENGAIHGHVIAGDWCDVGHPDAIAIAEQLLEAGRDVSQTG